MVFEKHFHEDPIFNSYLKHLASGLPARSWAFKGKGSIFLTAKSISKHMSSSFDLDMVEGAKAQGLNKRYEEMKELLKDPNTASPRLSVLKCINETFFNEHMNENIDVGLLFESVSTLADSGKCIEEDIE